MSNALSLSPDALAREMDGEILVLDLRSSHYFGLSGTGARIWQLVEAGARREAVIETLVGEFSGDPDQIRGEATAFLDDLIARGLILES